MFTVARAVSAAVGIKKCSACDMELAERHGADWIGLEITLLPLN